VAVRVPDQQALTIILKRAARIVTVSEAELRHAARAMFMDTRNLAEGAAAAPLAAALQERAKLAGKRVALIQSGGHIERALLAEGKLRVAEPGGGRPGGWQVHQWLKKAVLLSFRLNDMVEIPGGPVDPERGASKWWDKVPSKFAGWSANRFRDAGFRAVPGAI